MERMQCVFNMNMDPIETHEDYPKYARSTTKPVVRARHIIDRGVISRQPCSTCVELGQDCYRLESTFSKCAYCTSKDRKRELCHLPGQEASSSPERRKRRKITQNIYAPSGDAASNADTMMSGTLVTGTFASGLTPYPNIAMSIPRSFPAQAPTPEPTFAMTEAVVTQTVAPTILKKAEAEASSEATLERVTALESQVSGLESKVMDMLVKLDEVSSSCISSRSTTPNPQAVAGGCASSTTSDVTFQDLQARNVPDTAATTARRATMEWVQGSKISDAVLSPMEVATMVMVEGEANGSPKLEHTVEHAEGYRPVNCSCTRYECGGAIVTG